jgi:AGCS family alanine or glycine:cation symporter
MEAFNGFLEAVNGVIWHPYALYVVLGVGVIFTVWSGVCQYRSLSHGSAVTLGKYDEKDDPGAISHFQALSAALSATVGLGNIGGVAVAITLGGPGAVFWMWVIGVIGMALKTTEVTLSMLYRDTQDPENPQGGPMWVAKKAFAEKGLPGVGMAVGGVFCVTLLISTATGGNMFQAWNVAEVSFDEFGIPKIATGIVLCVLVAAVILGGIKRIGAVAGKLVPLMCGLYLLAAIYVLVLYIGDIPAMISLIFKSAFTPHEASGAFVGGAVGYAFLWGMQRALFSSEAGQGSSPIAHCAAKTKEPVREGVVAGLEPFIDTIVVCTLTSLVILSTGAWNREEDAAFVTLPTFTEVTDKKWTIGTTPLPPRTEDAKKISGSDWKGGDQVYVTARFGKENTDSANDRHRVQGRVIKESDDDAGTIEWNPVKNDTQPTLADAMIYKEYGGAALTSHAFNRATPGLGKWLVVLASWLFAISTMISWSYYGEQGIVFLAGRKAVLPYKLIYCGLIIISTASLIETNTELGNITALGTGLMLWANIPLTLIFASFAMKKYHEYGRKLKAGEFTQDEK